MKKCKECLELTKDCTCDTFCEDCGEYPENCRCECDECGYPNKDCDCEVEECDNFLNVK